MSRYINREDLLKNLKRFAPEHLTPLIVMLIEKQPTADVVEVVRCQDCKFYEEVEYYHPTEEAFKNICRLFKRQMQSDDFCSYGARMDEKE